MKKVAPGWHGGIESTRVYVHLTNDWLAGQYRSAAAMMDVDQVAVAAILVIQEEAGR